MALEALTTADDGTCNAPSLDSEWLDWVNATAVRNFMLEDPLLDWLDLYGRERGLLPDPETPGYDWRTDLSLFLDEKAIHFETAVVQQLKSLIDVTVITREDSETRRHEKAVATFNTMLAGRPVIYQGVLWDGQSKTYGRPDLLVRSDVTRQLFPNTIVLEGLNPAPDIGAANWHYRVIDIKFTTLDLLVSGELGNSGSNPAYKGQLFLYNRALGRLQGYLPPQSYLLGRGWEQTIKGQKLRSDSCMDRLAFIIQNNALASEVDRAIRWVGDVRQNGHLWDALPKPTVEQLYPNMGNLSDQPWSKAKKQIAQNLQELTMLWYVGAEKRR